MNIDLKKVSFSAPLDFLAITDICTAVWGRRFEKEGLYLRSIRKGQDETTGGIARLIFPGTDGELPYSYEASPWELVISVVGGGEVRATFDPDGQIRFIGKNTAMKLDILPNVSNEFLVYDQNRNYLNTPAYNSKLLFTRISGCVKYVDPGLEARKLPKAVIFYGDHWEARVEEFGGVVYDEKRVADSYETAKAQAKAAFEDYTAKACEGVPERFHEAALQAAYVNYSAQIEREGLLQGRVMLMSKNWMKSIWTWDCQFNAVETASYDPEAAWDNFASPFRMQEESGMLLDSVSDRCYHDAYTKPPIHGWSCSFLRKAGLLDDGKCAWAYEHLLKWTNAWYKYMDWDHDGVCQYNHGNDSGWDNCTYFLCGAPIEGPELSAYLTLCWDELSELAKKMGDMEAAKAHHARAELQLKQLLEHSWDGDHFHCYQSGTHNEKTDCDSLLVYLPIILGDLLPVDVFRKMVADLKEKDRFITPYGLATERVNNAYYVSDGYWRGPIWAPAMMFIIYGLARGGETDFAADLAERFCRNCAKEGFAENFDASSGAALRDRAYTWTSSVFLTLAKHYVKK